MSDTFNIRIKKTNMGKKFQHTDKNAGGKKDSKGNQKQKPGSPSRGAASSKKLAKKPS